MTYHAVVTDRYRSQAFSTRASTKTINVNECCVSLCVLWCLFHIQRAAHLQQFQFVFQTFHHMYVACGLDLMAIFFHRDRSVFGRHQTALCRQCLLVIVANVVTGISALWIMMHQKSSQDIKRRRSTWVCAIFNCWEAIESGILNGLPEVHDWKWVRGVSDPDPELMGNGPGSSGLKHWVN